jgi:hypothetical protein
VRRSRHEQQVPGVAADALGEAEAAGLFEPVAEEEGRELARLVEDREVPARGAELLGQHLVAGQPSRRRKVKAILQ